MTMYFDDFKKLYPLSKTLRFEAKPVGPTFKHIKERGLLEEDEHRAISYVKVKKLIDEYHKAFVGKALNNGCLLYESCGNKNSLIEYYETYKSKEGEARKTMKEIQKNLREMIVGAFEKEEDYANLFKGGLIEPYKSGGKHKEPDILRLINTAGFSQLAGMSQEEAKSLIKEFWRFTTYFVGFFDNRGNMYTSEEKSTGIAYRLINENLPRFIDNMEIFNKIIGKSEIQARVTELYSDFEGYLNVGSIQEMFKLDYYNALLTQKQIDVYNAIISGRTTTGPESKKIKGLNEYINLYNQQHKDGKLPKFKPLFKQILSDREALSWLPDEFVNDQEMLNAIKNCYEKLTGNILGESALKVLLSSLADYDLGGIFVRNDSQLTNISQRMFGRWDAIQNAILQDIRKTAPMRKRRESEEDYENRIDKMFKKADSFSIKYINDCIREIAVDDTLFVEDYFATLGAVNTPTIQRENLFLLVQNAFTDVADLLNSEYSAEKSLAQDSVNVSKIKALLDAIKSLQQFVRPLLGNGDENEKDERFYGEFTSLWAELDEVTLLYDMVRNRMTRKPYSQKKIKLNFANPKLLNGWDENKEKDNSCIILRRDGKYYLAVMDKKSKNLLGKPMPSDGECYEKMVYKLLPGAQKMFPKVFFAKSRIDEFKPSEHILNIYSNGTHKKGTKNFNIEDCHDLIDFFKESIRRHKDWNKFGFEFSDTSTYENVNEFYREADEQGYKLSFVNVSVAYIDKLVNEGEMYLFQIYNKDFSEYSKGTPNMHTLYWKALFDDRNLVDMVYKLNGQAELFYRKKSLDSIRPTHPANQPIKNKNKNNKKKESLFEYDLVKDRRYTVDKFMFHVPITMNFKNAGLEKINQQVREYLQQADDTHIIGIDRGERHLLYLVVIDMHGNIKEQFSLNEIVNECSGNTYHTNYHALLDAREEERLNARRSWQTIESIKELKEGYLSQVIHRITQLMVKYHAIVVLEDLSMGFMRGRQKVEKQVYQKFEKMLIDKLNYLVDKKVDVSQPGGLLNAYQLTNKFESFQSSEKQSGFVFYIPAWNTSKIDPVTGFVNLLDTRYQNVEKARAFFSKFDAIRYNKDKDWFEFGVDYDNFNKKAEGTMTKWTLCTQGVRICTFRNAEKNSQWDTQEVDLTTEMKSLFGQSQIDVNGNLKEAICSQSDKTFFMRLLHLLKLMLQMRNSITGTEIDYLVSPVADGNGNFYDSRKCDSTLPKNADANGAYNIARKGLMLLRQMKTADNLTDVKFDMTNRTWLKFAQQKPYKDE